MAWGAADFAVGTCWRVMIPLRKSGANARLSGWARSLKQGFGRDSSVTGAGENNFFRYSLDFGTRNGPPMMSECSFLVPRFSSLPAARTHVSLYADGVCLVCM